MGWTCHINRGNKKEGNIEEWKCFRSKIKMIEYIISKVYSKTCLYVFGHNIFHDLKALDFFRYAKKEEWNIELLIDNGKTSFLKVRKETKSIAFLSTTNFFSYSLRILGKNIGIEKSEVDFDSSSYSDIKKYCKQDVTIIKEIMLKLFEYIQINELGTFCITAASQAMFSFRYRFMTTKIFPCNDENIISLERESFHGGRTEAFYIGKLLQDSIKVYDINSMYPYVMRNNYYPTYAKYVYKKMKISKLKHLIKYYCVIAKVKLKTNDNMYAYKYNGRLVFPTGTFISVLTTPEIIYALNHNHIKQIYDVVLYSRGKIFSSYVDFFYRQKQYYKKIKNKPYETLTKLYLNSLYGKFGQRGYKQSVDINYTSEIEKRERIIDLETGKVVWKTQLINTTIIDEDDKSPIHTSVVISSHVTAYARVHLFSLIKKAGRNNVYYCDTDSLFINVKAEKRLKDEIHETVLGKLKLEKQPHNLRIYGLKDYEIDGKATLKGIRNNAVRIGENKYKQEQFESLKTAIRKQHLDKPYVSYIIKTLKREYTKGIVTRSGKVKPFHFSWLRDLIDYLHQ